MTQWNNIVQLSKDFIRAITPDTGTTTNSYVTSCDLDTRWLGETTITIANTDTNSLDYQVLVYNDYQNGIAHTITTNTIVGSDTDQIQLNRHARVVIQVKSTLSDNHTDYQIDAIAGR